MFKTMFNLLAAAALAFLVGIAPGCSSLGVPTPTSQEERALVALAAITDVRDTASVLLKAKKISVEDAENIQRQADSMRAGVDLARSLISTNPVGADAKLQQAQIALTALQAYLATKEKS